MPVGFNSPARNLFLLGSSGAQTVTNFFKSIDQSSTTDGVFLPDEIRYNYTDQKYVLAGSAADSNSKGFGWFEKRDETGALDFANRVESTVAGVNTTLRAMELDSNNNLIVAGFSGTTPWIAKYSNAGVLDWQSTTNSANVRYTGLASDSNGNYYASGRTSYALPDTQAFVEKFDSNGNPGWGKSAFILGRDVVLRKISANSRGEVVAVGFLEDDSADKGYIVKIDTNTGEVLWDRTLERNISGHGFGTGSTDSITPADVRCMACYIDSNDQIYVVGSIDGNSPNNNGVGEFLIKYTAEGNMVWQRENNTRDFNASDGAPNMIPFDVKSDGETEQTVVLSVEDNGPFALNNSNIFISKYSKNGDLVYRRQISKGGENLGNASLDADPSFYYILFEDQEVDGLAGTPDRYTFGKVSTSGNGLGAFQYDDGAAPLIDYTIVSSGRDAESKIGRLSDGSVRNDTSDLITYPFTANKLVFDDLATHVSNKKRQMDNADSFEYSGSPSIRPADFQELNLLGDTGIVAATGTNYTAQISGTQFNASNPKEHAFDGNLSNWTTALNGTSLTWTPSGGLAVSSSLRLYAAREAATDNITVTFTDTSTFNSFTADNTFKWYDITGAAGKTISNINWTHNNTFSRIAAIEVDGVILVDPRGGWTDQSGKGNDGVVNGPTHNADGYWEFDGVDDGIKIPRTHLYQTGDEISVEAWINIDDINDETYQAFFTIGGVPATNRDRMFQMRVANYTGSGGGIGHIDALYRNSANTGWQIIRTTGTPIANNIWYHVVSTYTYGTGSSWKIYINGVEQSTTYHAGTGNDDPIQPVDPSIYIGLGEDGRPAFNTGSGEEWLGKIGEVRLYHRTLTAAQVFQNYNATKSKFINEAPNIAPKIGPGIVYGSNLTLNYDFGNRVTYDRVENLYRYSNNFDKDGAAENFWSGDMIGLNNRQYMGKIGPNGEDVWQFDLIQKSGGSEGEASFQQRIQPGYAAGTVTSQRWLMRSAPGYGTQTVYHKHGRNAVYAANQANVEFDITEEWSEITTTDSVYAGATKAFFGIGTVNAGVVVQIASAQLWVGSDNARYVDTYGVRLTAPTTVKNLSSSSNTGTVNGPTFNPAGYFSFDGVDDEITVDNITHGTSALTYECWVRTANGYSPSDYVSLMSTYDPNPQGFWILLNPTNAYVAAGNDGSTFHVSSTAVNDGNWHHVVATYDNPNVRIYVDGVDVGGLNNAPNNSIPTRTLRIGSMSINGNTDRFLAGDIGKARIYTKALTAAEVSQNYNATRSKYGV